MFAEGLRKSRRRHHQQQIHHRVTRSYGTQSVRFPVFFNFQFCL